MEGIEGGGGGGRDGGTHGLVLVFVVVLLLLLYGLVELPIVLELITSVDLSSEKELSEPVLGLDSLLVSRC